MNDGVTALKSALPEAGWTQDADIIAPHLVEWRDKYFGRTPLMLTPRNTEEVVTAVKLCAQYGLKLVPQGGNTGLVGGQTPQDEILMSLKKMTTIRDVNTTNNALIAEAGATLLSVQDTAKDVGRKFPLSLASEGTCTIGGVVSTNAGGVHVLKYGTTKDLVFGVEAVLPSGDIFNGLTNLRKDNTGYDLNRLFLGAEGTLGVITAASLKLFPRPGHIQRVMMGVDSPDHALSLLDHCRMGDTLAMFEVIPSIALELVLTHISGQRDPFPNKYPWYALLDWEVETEAQGLRLAETTLESAFEKGLITDAVIARNETQAAHLLALREHISAAQKHNGGSIKQDITLPLDRIPDFLKQADAAVMKIVPGCRPVAFGHFGDGNIHYNIAQPEGADKKDFLNHWDRVSHAVFDIVESMGGSISAEHGIGIMKRENLAARANKTKMTLLKAVKHAFDPHNMMNPRVLI